MEIIVVDVAVAVTVLS